jgi:hypothetical protein
VPKRHILKSSKHLAQENTTRWQNGGNVAIGSVEVGVVGKRQKCSTEMGRTRIDLAENLPL